MNFERFIALRVASNNRSSFSGKIIRIAIAAIAVSMAVMIIATALVTGFKNEISEKIFGFWGHIHIRHYKVENSIESIPILKAQNFYPGSPKADPADTYITDVGRVEYMKQGKFLGFDYEYKTKTKAGIRHIQSYANKAGIIKTKDQLEGIVLKGIGDDFNWDFLSKFIVEGERLPYGETSSRNIMISESTSKRLNVKLGDVFDIFFVENGQELVRRFKTCAIYKTGLEEYDQKFAVIDIREIQKLNGWTENEVSGFEVFIEDIRDLEVFGEYVYYNYIGPELYSNTIKEIYPGIFSWLELQNVNERIIIILMIIVSIINMITALMILILERTNMIGILKALGAKNWSVRKIFLYHAFYIIGMGILIGNAIGIGFCLIQQQFGIITLPQEAYYVSVAPVALNLFTIFLLNLMTVVVTILVLIIPSYLVTKVEPVKAIRFK